MQQHSSLRRPGPPPALSGKAPALRQRLEARAAVRPSGDRSTPASGPLARTLISWERKEHIPRQAAPKLMKSGTKILLHSPSTSHSTSLSCKIRMANLMLRKPHPKNQNMLQICGQADEIRLLVADKSLPENHTPEPASNLGSSRARNHLPVMAHQHRHFISIRDVPNPRLGPPPMAPQAERSKTRPNTPGRPGLTRRPSPRSAAAGSAPR